MSNVINQDLGTFVARNYNMLTTIKGYYEKGRIIMDENAPVQEKTPVIITFLTDEPVYQEPKKRRIPGALKGKVSIPDNFNDPLKDLEDYT